MNNKGFCLQNNLEKGKKYQAFIISYNNLSFIKTSIGLTVHLNNSSSIPFDNSGQQETLLKYCKPHKRFYKCQDLTIHKNNI